MMIKHCGLVTLLLMAACSADTGPSPFHEGVGLTGAGAPSPPSELDAAAGDGTRQDAGAAEASAPDAGPLAEACRCGNGTLDPGEKCDDSAPKHRCPTSQNDCEATRDICWRWRVAGEGCHRECVHAHGVCEDVLDPREPAGLYTACRNECAADSHSNSPWQ